MSDLQKRIDRLYQRKVIEVVAQKQRYVGLTLLGQIKLLTPVDTGRARSNWHLDIGAPTVSIVEAGGDLVADLTGHTVDKSIFISNNLSYIKPLDEGHSQQAPAGMVQDAIASTLTLSKRRYK